VGDDLLIAATPTSLEQFQQRIASPEMAGDEAIEEWEEKQQATIH